MKANRMKDVLEAVARHGVPENMNLWPNISARLERKSLMMNLRARPVLLMIMVLLAMGLLTGIAYAVGNLLGYVPGVGLVDQGVPVRVLKTPIEVMQGRLRITILNVV